MIESSASALWARLRQAGLVAGDAPAEAVTVTPWYIRTMLGIAGWIGAMFLLGFVGAGFAIVMDSPIAALILGALLCAAATFMFRTWPESDFLEQFALAVSIAGQVLLAVGLSRLLPAQSALFALVFAVVQAGLFRLVPNFLHRVLAAGVGAGALVQALNLWGFAPYTQALVFAVFGWAWLNEFRLPGRDQQMRALGYGLALMVIFGLVTRSNADLWRVVAMDDGIGMFGGAFGFWIGNALVGALTLWVVWRLLVRQGVAPGSGAGLAALAGALIVGLISLKAPGLGVTVTILLLGYANGNRVLAGLGIVSLLAYWSYYYYSLEITLLQKSALLVCAGIVLLAARIAMKRRWPAVEPEGGGHA